jgi:hypothetical protein
VETAPPAPAKVRRFQGFALPGLVAVVVILAAAEACLAAWPPFDGFSLEGRIAFSLILHVEAIFLLMVLGLGARSDQTPLSEYFFALTLAPATRIISLALPPALFGDADLFVRLSLVVLPLFAGVGMLVHTRNLAPWQTGLTVPKFGSAGPVLWTLLAAVAIPAAAFGEYMLLDPAVPKFSGARIAFYALVLILVALWQELVFRGLFVQLGARPLGPQTAVFFAALWFAVMHIGVQDGLSIEVLGAVGIALATGWIAGQQARSTGSVAVTWLAYSLAMVLYFLALPRLL